ncbi:OsmC family protein [Streptomyces avidinii]|uniref:Organic hydroperoxide reductase OsmC/OhrA n=1 Tax=Streptomyces avidinii TaxID=1895 RepID=A0ABS4L251_STRAV|nr:OsmC family protein [Streptomyces avidinii]MBP2035975.1 organic hydroperoxide reductase OsmC/OhrA [Streptomyces avidinii]GGY98323.1 peroxiredoxin [Streptomyces avidinii]
MARLHSYTTRVTWTGNLGTGTSHYRAYSRAHEVVAAELPAILGSADPTFRGDASRWNPEQLLLAALSQCHMLSYLHFCTINGVVVTSYVDEATGTMATAGDSGQFTEAVVHPRITVGDESMVAAAISLHEEAHRACFIANSVNFPVRHEPTVTVG